jgi:hypothetical protein
VGKDRIANVALSLVAPLLMVLGICGALMAIAAFVLAVRVVWWVVQ